MKPSSHKTHKVSPSCTIPALTWCPPHTSCATSGQRRPNTPRQSNACKKSHPSIELRSILGALQQHELPHERPYQPTTIPAKLPANAAPIILALVSITNLRSLTKEDCWARDERDKGRQGNEEIDGGVVGECTGPCATQVPKPWDPRARQGCTSSSQPCHGCTHKTGADKRYEET